MNEHPFPKQTLRRTSEANFFIRLSLERWNGGGVKPIAMQIARTERYSLFRGYLSAQGSVGQVNRRL